MSDEKDHPEPSPGTAQDSIPENSVAQDGAAQDGAPRGRLLTHLLDEDVDLDEAFDRLLDAQQEIGVDHSVLKSVLPGDSMASGDMTLAVLLASVLSEYEDIEQLIEGLRESPADSRPLKSIEDAVAVVSEAELANPEALSKALEPLQETTRFERLFEVAKGALDELDIYELSRKSPNDLVAVLRQGGNLRTVQTSVDFLRSLNIAADTFESMDLPRPHIREYLRHLYLMRDWDEMARLVGLLEVAVAGLAETPQAVSTPPMSLEQDSEA